MTKEEMETIVNFTEAEDTASIYTYNVALKNKLAKVRREISLSLSLDGSDRGRQYDV